MLGTAIAPEVLISKNLGDLTAVRFNIKRLQELAKEDGVPWTITHSLFANMGGFVIRSHVPERFGGLVDSKAGPDTSELHLESRKSPDGVESESMERLGSTFNSGDQSYSNGKDLSTVESQVIATQLYSNPYHLLAPDILALREANLLPRLPYITKSELNDKSKSDSLVRIIAVLQILWTVIQVSIRHSRHLAISQLEISVVAFSICAIIIYGLNWEKPKGVQVPYTLLQYRSQTPEAVLEKLREPRGTGWWVGAAYLVEFFFTLGFLPESGGTLPGSPVPNHFTIEPDLRPVFTSSDMVQFLGVLLGGLVFGSIHILAWDFVFPALIERTLWWAASILCTILPLLFLGWTVLGSYMGLGTSVFDIFWGLNMFILILLYITARLFLLVEIFRTLCFLLPSAFVATWATNIPHVA
jgi:hypothetical protein